MRRQTEPAGQKAGDARAAQRGDAAARLPGRLLGLGLRREDREADGDGDAVLAVGGPDHLVAAVVHEDGAERALRGRGAVLRLLRRALGVDAVAHRQLLAGEEGVDGDRRPVLLGVGDVVLRVRRGGGATEEKEGSGSAVSLGRSLGAGSSLAFLPEPVGLVFLLAEMTAVATIAPIAAVASTPPPISSHLLRRLRAADSSASAAQSGVCVPPGPQEGPLAQSSCRDPRGDVNRLGQCFAGRDNAVYGTS